MKAIAQYKSSEQGAATIFYLLMMLVVISLLAAAMTYVSGSVRLERRRGDLIAAQQYAEGGAVIACDELNTAYGKSGTLATNVTSAGYTLSSALSTSAYNVYTRTISSPFTNYGQTVTAQLWLSTSTSAKSAKVVTIATKDSVTQSATVNLQFSWGYPAAIISTNAGTTTTSTGKSAAQAGNVAIDGNTNGTVIVDANGGSGKAILANGSANWSSANVTSTQVSAHNYGTSSAIPDYTAQGTANALFDFNRFVAVADSTPNTLSASGTNHFASLADFMKANAAAAATPAGALEGVIVVDITATSSSGKTGDVGIDVLANPDNYVGTTYMPAVSPSTKGITVRGSLFFKFGSAYGPLDKIFNRTPMNINPANLSGFNAADPTTYPSGYPPTYYDSSKNPANIDITSKGYTNFAAGEDLPALMYSIGTVDMHGSVNISGVVYTPSYMEEENMTGEGFKIAKQLQYIKGTVIVGLGYYLANNNVATTIVSYDPNALTSIATKGNAGKLLTVAYWQ
jgi:hypothetical protein